MASYRQIHTKIWKDGWFLDLPPDNKLLFIYLFSNERANLIGLYDLPLRVVAFETGLELESVEWGMEQLEKAGKVYYENGWVWVTNLLRYNATNIDSPKIKTHIVNTLGEIPDCQLKRRLIAYYATAIPYIYGMKHNRTEQEQEQEQETEQEQEQEKEQQQTGGHDTAAGAVLEDVHRLGVTDPKAQNLVNAHEEVDELPLLVPRLRGWIDHYVGQDKVTNPIGLAITKVEAFTDPPTLHAPADDRRRYASSEFAQVVS